MDTPPVGSRPGIGVAGVLAVALVVYWILLGGTEAGHVIAPLRALNAALSGILIWLWVRRMPSERDRIDDFGLVGLCAFLVVAAFSQFPRPSLDAGVSALAWLAALYHARRFARLGDLRTFALTMLGVAGALLALLIAVLWGVVWMRWLELVDFESAPPLTIRLPLLVFRHVHVVAFTVVLLQPAVLSLWRFPLLRPLVGLSLVAAAAVAYASGSRTVWGAVVLAGGLVVVDRWVRGGMRVPSGRILAFAALGLLGAFVGLWATGLADPLIERVSALQTLGARGEIWAAALSGFQHDPLTGSGPGTFVPALPLSGYFAVNEFPPRHADNALIQLLSEGGLIAAAGVGLAVITIGARLLRHHQSRMGLWAVWFFAFASVADNPSDTAGLNALLLVWVALALPAETAPGRSQIPKSAWTPIRVAHIGAFALVCIAFVATSSAHLLRDVAVERVASNDYKEALHALQIAVVLDPGHPLYRRELGLLELVDGDPSAARRTLLRASAMAPTDDVTLRSLAVVEAIMRNREGATSAAARAMRLRPSDPMNLLLPATFATDTDLGSVGHTGVLQALELDPLLAAAPSWERQLSRIGEPAELLVLARGNATTAKGVTISVTFRRMWLRAVASAGPPSRADEEAARESDLLITSRAWTLLMDCRLAQADSTIRSGRESEGDSDLYWFVRAVIAEAAGSDAGRARQLAVLMNPAFGAYAVSLGPRSPVVDPVADRRTYSRLPMMIRLDNLELPSDLEAWGAWWRDPFAAAAAGAPATELARCRS